MKTTQILNYSDVLDHGTTTKHLLLGNGFSIACDPVFKYNNIFQFAKEEGLSIRVQELFAHFGTTNFELVARSLSDLKVTAMLYDMLKNKHRKEIERDIEEIKEALISAVARTHLESPDQLSETQRSACVDFLKPYQNVFTTNYDLLLYWSTMQGTTNRRLTFQDGFRSSIDNPTADYVVFSKRLGNHQGLFYLHGALHLFESDGEVRKHCWNRSGITLTEHVVTALKENNSPLFVAEGKSIHKLEHIQRSGYLAYCYQKLQAIQSTLVVCGSSLGDSDEHILNAIADSDSPTVWLGVYGGASGPAASNMEIVGAKLLQRRAKSPGAKKLNVYYYDVSTAPIWTAKPDAAVKKPASPALLRSFGQREASRSAV